MIGDARMTPRQCEFAFKAHVFCGKLLASKFAFVQAFGGLGQQLLMSYVYVSVLQAGQQIVKAKENEENA